MKVKSEEAACRKNAARQTSRDKTSCLLPSRMIDCSSPKQKKQKEIRYVPDLESILPRAMPAKKITR